MSKELECPREDCGGQVPCPQPVGGWRDGEPVTCPDCGSLLLAMVPEDDRDPYLVDYVEKDEPVKFDPEDN